MSKTATFYRNTFDITSIEGIEVDAGSLWKLQEDNTLMLIDDDQHVTSNLNGNFKPDTRVSENKI